MVTMREVFEERRKREMKEMARGAFWAKVARVAEKVGSAILLAVALWCIFHLTRLMFAVVVGV